MSRTVGAILLTVFLVGTTLPSDVCAAGTGTVSHGGLQWDKPVSYTPPKPASSKPAARAKVDVHKQVHALFQHGLDYFMGKGVSKSVAMAVVMWRKAAGQGDANAQSCLAYLYYRGIGVSKSYKEAAKWYRKAAQAGASDAQHNLGVMYYLGQGVLKDNVLAMEWLMLAKANGYNNAVKELQYVAGGSSPGQIAKARTMAAERSGAKHSDIRQGSSIMMMSNLIKVPTS